MAARQSRRPRGKMATLADLQVLLTPTEYRLLEVLREQPGRVFSRPDLIALVMPGTVVLNRTIDVHVQSLRKKLGPRGQCIRTVRKGGYCFRENNAI